MLFTGDGTTYLRSDGIFATFLKTNYAGSLLNVNAKLLLIGHDSPIVAFSNVITNLNNVITTLGGIVGTYSGSTGIYINLIVIDKTLTINSINSTSGLTTGSGGYDNNYDSITYWNYDTPYADTSSILNTWYNNNKGVCLMSEATSTKYTTINLTKNISTFGPLVGDGVVYAQSSSFPVLYGVSNINPESSTTSMIAINGASSIGSINGTNAINYLDDNIKGRRLDCNFNPH